MLKVSKVRNQTQREYLTEKVSLAISTIKLAGERGSIKAFTMKSSWRWSHGWKWVSLKRINIEHIFGFVHADFYMEFFILILFALKIVFTFHIFLFILLLLSKFSHLSITFYGALVQGRGEALLKFGSRNRIPQKLLRSWWSFVHFTKNIVYPLLLFSK